MFEAVAPVRAYEAVVRQIKDRILDGTFPPGSKLPPERELASQFAISRTSVREALTVLRQLGLVEVRTGAAGGARVTVPSADAIGRALQFVLHVDRRRFADLLEARQTIEPRIASLAAGQRDAQEVALLAAHLARMLAGLDDADAFARADVAFHLQLARASHNVIYQGLLESLGAGLLDSIRDLARVPTLRSQGLCHHQRLLGAIERQDDAAAADHMREHFVLVGEAFAQMRRLNGTRRPVARPERDQAPLPEGQGDGPLPDHGGKRADRMQDRAAEGGDNSEREPMP